MRVLVYVEGPSDRVALETLLEPIILAGQQRGVGIRFLPLHSKASVLNDCPRKAADHIAENPVDWIFALPDLYPSVIYDETENAHRTREQLEQVLRSRFRARADKVGAPVEARTHFRVHCLKHDLEALLLAAPEALRLRLGTTDALSGRWRRPVEDQDEGTPPKRVIEALFNQYRKKPGYIEATDAPWILKRASLDSIVLACPQCFGPFVAELKALANTGTL